MPTYQYSRWDGSQEALAPTADDLMDRLSERLMSTGNLTSALKSLMRDSLPSAGGEPKGIDALLKRLLQKRRDILERYDIGSVVRSIRERLDEVERLEREGIARRLQEASDVAGDRSWADVLKRVAARYLKSLDALPQDAAGRLRGLDDYEFLDPQARAQFQQLADSLRQKAVERHLKGLAQRLQGIAPETRSRLSEMLKDLNRLLRERIEGGQPNFRAFRRKYADFLGSGSPDTLDDLAEQLQRHAAQMESMLGSMSAEMRQQLQDMIGSLLEDDSLLGDMTEVAGNLESLYPMRSLRRSYPFKGEGSVTLDEALELVEQLQALDTLESQLKCAQATVNLSGVDGQLLQRAMGSDALHHLEALRGIVGQLEDSGYLSYEGNRYELTPKGTRRIGQKALAEIFAWVKRNGAGAHRNTARGDGGEITEDTKRYEFGDAFAPHLHKSLMNAAVRQASLGRPEDGVLPLRLHPDDLEVYQPEHLSRASTVLMIDLSLSMAMRGSFLAAKKVALALHNLITTRFPHDSLYIVGFSTYAREVKPDALPYLNWDEFDPYTNIQHALELAQQLLARCAGGTRQIIMVSDGEPTAHVEEGQLYLQYPPSPRTLAHTLKEVKHCKAKGITINTFMLDRNARLVEFVDQMTRMSRGRVFYTTPEQLGQYVVVDYCASRRLVLR